jgi:hypothetical protein
MANYTVVVETVAGIEELIIESPGPQGAQGIPGVAGVAGVAGIDGATGATGATGPQGIQGVAGATGATGATGPQGEYGGPQGPIGPTGPQGNVGPTGPIGPAGIQGIQGVKGDKGDIGNTGATGLQGIQGIQGIKGDNGNAGIQGEQGIQGVKGDTGLQGIQGIQGIKGDTGIQGIQGVAGPTGAKGDTGNTGAAGATGAKGDTGNAGATGATGATGPQGIQGVAGATGATGATGPQGATGATGTTTSIIVTDTASHFVSSPKSVENVLAELFTFANDGKTGIAGVVGSPSTSSETFAQLVTDIQSRKTTLAANLTAKGVTTVNTDTLYNMAAAVASITGGGVTPTKINLNITAPYQRVITFTSPVLATDLCVSLIYYTPGTQNVSKYTCNFGSGDSSGFNVGANIVFNGVMYLPNKTTTGNFTDIGVIGTGELWESPSLDNTIFYTIDSLSSTTGAVPTLTINGTNLPVVTSQNSNIDLTGIYQLMSITLTVNRTGTGVVLAVLSFDNGTTWYAWNGSAFITVNITSLSDFKSKGMTATVINALTLAQLESQRGSSTTLRFAYYIEMGAPTDTANIDTMQVNASLPGTYGLAPSTNYTATLAGDGTTLTYNLSTSGIYVINYMG